MKMARREAPSRLRVLPAQGPLWKSASNAQLAPLEECHPHTIRQTASPLERAPESCGIFHGFLRRTVSLKNAVFIRHFIVLAKRS